MVELSVGATSVAHGIHYAIVGVGLVGVLSLLGPQLVTGRRAPSVRDEHTLRVLALTDQISSGGLGVGMTPGVSAYPTRTAAVDHVRTFWLPLAVVSSAAAAGVHAAVGPVHFREGLALGMFFVVAALAQIGWSFAMVIRPSHTLLVAAVAGNSAVLLLWVVTRTIGLPGFLPGPEAVGLWDVCSGLWEVAVVLAAARILLTDSDDDLRLPAWSDWGPRARLWALGSAAALPLLSLTGVGT